MTFLLFTLNKYLSLVNTTIAYFEYFLLTKIVLPFEFRTNENNFNYSEFMANFAQWSKNIPSRRWRHKTVPVPALLLGMLLPVWLSACGRQITNICRKPRDP